MEKTQTWKFLDRVKNINRSYSTMKTNRNKIVIVNFCFYFHFYIFTFNNFFFTLYRLSKSKLQKLGTKLIFSEIKFNKKMLVRKDYVKKLYFYN